MSKNNLFMLISMLIIFLSLISSSIVSKNIIYPIRYKHNIYKLDYENYQYIVTGHSQARDSILMDSSNLVLNLGLAGQDLQFIVRILDKYEHAFSKDATIIIEFSHNSLCNINDASQSRYLPLGFEFSELNLTLSELILESYFPLFGINKTELIMSGSHYANNLYDYDSLHELMDDKHKYISLNLSRPLCNQTTIMKNLDYLISIINTQQSKGRRVVLYHSPYYIDSKEDLKTDRSSLYNMTLDSLKREFPNIVILDHSYHSIISRESIYFRDFNHLNNSGANKYQEILFAELEYVFLKLKEN